MNIQQHADYLLVNDTKYPYYFLYDNAPENYHENGQKLTKSSAVSLDIKPVELDIQDDAVVIQWGEKESVYPNHYFKKLVEKDDDERIYWSCRTDIHQHDYNDISTDDAALLECLKDIAIYGFTHIVNVPTKSEMVLKLVELFGYVKETNYGKYYDVIARKNPENLADTGLGLPCHTDNPYRDPAPTIQLLHCLKSGVDGGETSLVDGFFVAQMMREEQPDFFRVLTEQKVKFQFVSKDHHLENWDYIIGLDPNKELRHIKFNNRSIQPFPIPYEVMESFYKAYQYFENMLDSEQNQTRFKLEPGEAIIYDNERILHGRTAYTLLAERHLQGCYADRDAVYSKIKTLQRGEK